MVALYEKFISLVNVKKDHDINIKKLKKLQKQTINLLFIFVNMQQFQLELMINHKLLN